MEKDILFNMQHLYPSQELINDPTDNDVLLGRGVATNRHPGNVRFRNFVGEHVKTYVTSTKKQKMLISRSIVATVNTEWDPPGRFLEKQPSGVWTEVPIKKALEKTAQALRDGAFPLRKQLSEDFSDPSFLEAVFDAKVDQVVTPSAGTKPSHLRKTKGHRRITSAPMVAAPVNFDFLDPDPKRSKPNSPNYSLDKTSEDVTTQQGQSLTGINFPSPHVQEDLEFQIGSSNANDTRGARSHRRNRTFGGYSCSDGNVSDLPVDDIFAMFLNPQKDQNQDIGSIVTNPHVDNMGDTPRQNDVPLMPNNVPASVDFSQQQSLMTGISTTDFHLPLMPNNVPASVDFNQQPSLMTGMSTTHTDHMVGVPNTTEDFIHQQFQTVQMPQQQLLHNNHAIAPPVLQIDPNMLNHLYNASSSQVNVTDHVAPQNQPMGSMPQCTVAQTACSEVTSAAQLMNNTGMVFEQSSPVVTEHTHQQVNNSQQQLNFSNPSLMSSILETSLQGAVTSDTSKNLSGVKRHRRYNTIATGHCYSTHRTSKPTSTQTKPQNFDLEFLNNIHLPAESLHDELDSSQPIIEGASSFNIHDFSSFEIPLAAPSPSTAKGRHRRLNTTGHLSSVGLPGDFEFSLDKRPFLNTIHEEIPHIPLTADCGSIMSSEAKSINDSKLSHKTPPSAASTNAILNSIIPSGSIMSSEAKSTNDSKLSHETPPSAASINAILNSVIPSVDTAHRRNESTKSSLSNEDFCFHMVAGGEGFDDDYVVSSGDNSCM